MDKQLVANELLAFLQNRLDVMDEVSIAQIVRSSFSEEEIRSAKKLLFESLNKIEQMPSRRKDDKGERSLQDIITVLKETDPDDVPEFVARGGQLHKLPPVNFDHVDVTRLLKDITSLKASLAEMQLKFEASQNTIGELRAEVSLLRNDIAVTRSPETSNVNVRRGAQNASVSSFESAKLDASSPVTATETARAAPRPAPRTPPAAEPPRVITCTPARAYAAITAGQNLHLGRKEIGRNHCEINHNTVTTGSRQDPSDQEGFTVVERKKKKKPPCRNRCGTAPVGRNHLLVPAIPTTLLYVSRLHFSIKAEDVAQYVATKTNIRPRVELLESRHNSNSFKSFVVRIPTQHLATFMSEEFWPKGVVFRRFRGKIPNTQTRSTSQTLRT